MRFKSRFTIIGALAAVVLSLLIALPVLAGSQTIGKVTLAVQGGALSTVDYAAKTQDTKVGTTQYVANSNAAFNRVVISVVGAGGGASGAGNDTITLQVKNESTNAKITVTMQEGGTTAGTFISNAFLVTGITDASASPQTIAATDGNIIAVTFTNPQTNLGSGNTLVTGSGDVVKLKVDATKPTITAVAPAHASTFRPGSVDFSASITDAGSGIRADVAPPPGAGGPGDGASDGDVDGITSAEPRTIGTNLLLNANLPAGFTTPTDDGKTVDLRIFRKAGTTPTNVASFGTQSDDFSNNALWTSITNGYSFSATVSPAAGTHKYGYQAMDRVGNITRTDSSATVTGQQAHTLTIDDKSPQIGLAETGVAWDVAKKEQSTKTNRKVIKLSFSAAGATPATTNYDLLDTTTVQKEDFVVQTSATNTAELAIESILHPNMKIGTGGVKPSIETRHLVYITLVDELPSNAKPKVRFVGTVTDLAGNSAPSHDKVSTDKIGPKFTVTITGAATSGRPVARGNKVGNGITVAVESDEPITGTPTIYFETIKFDDTTDNRLEVNAVSSVTPTLVSGETKKWTTTQLSTVAAEGLVSVFIRGTDSNTVQGSSGSGGTAAAAPTGNEAIDLTKANLFRFDNTLSAGTVTVTPNIGSTITTTESTSPFLRLNFPETQEQAINTSGGADPATATPLDTLYCGKLTAASATVCQEKNGPLVGTSPTAVEIDTGNNVTLTVLTLDGVDVLGTQGTVGVDKTNYGFVLATSGLAVGTHTLEFNGTDDVGNTYTSNQKFTFTVKARAAYKVALSPGWNLVSVPLDPADTSIDAVLPSTHPATDVLTYAPNDANGPWLVASRTSGQNWSDNAANTGPGGLTEIVAGRGYWIKTGAFAPMATLIPERNPASVLPTHKVYKGWNLLGVTDVAIGAKTATNSGDNYLASVSWNVAYTFDTQSNKWTKLSKGVSSGGVVNNTQGLWVWVTKDGTLAP